MALTLATRRAILAVAAVALGAAVFLASATPAEARSRVIQADNVIGGYKVKKDGTLAGAIAVFGQPSSTRARGRSSTCNVRWKRLGVRILFANFGGGDACDPAQGFFTRATITGRGWRTASGLKIRNSWQRIEAKHPNATYNGAAYPSGSWWLVARPNPFASTPGEVSPRLLANVRDGRVAKLTVNFHGAGD